MIQYIIPQNAQMGATDMSFRFVCTWPIRKSADLPVIDFAQLGRLTFERADLDVSHV